MIFDPEDYVSDYETIILKGTILYHGYVRNELCKIILTNKKIIQAGDNFLNIVPFNQISNINGPIEDRGMTYFYINTSDVNPVMSIGSTSNYQWLNQIIEEIAKRIG